MIDAAKEAAVKHVVFSSVAACALHCLDRDDFLLLVRTQNACSHTLMSLANAGDKEFAPGYLQSKKTIEDHLKESGLSWTILRPVAFLEIWARSLSFPHSSPLHGPTTPNAHHTVQITPA
eukprot:3007040-Rhodomonas_salina.2